MKKLISILCILFMSSSITFGQAKAQTQPQTKDKMTKTKPGAAKDKEPSNTDEFPKLIADYYQAWNTLKLDEPAKYYSQEPGLVFYDILPLQYKGWKEYQSGVTKLLQDFTSFKLIPNQDLSIARKGKIAWTTLTLRISGKKKDGTVMDQDARHTAIWEKSKGKWLIVHEHVSVPLPAPAAK